MLAEAVQMAFHHLVHCLQYDLQRTLPAFLDENDYDEEEMGMSIGLDKRKNQRKLGNIFLPITFSICFGCSKEPSH